LGTEKTTLPPAGTRRIALGVEYDGTDYKGWQQQPHAPSVQETLSTAISAVAAETIQCTGAGRTDSGVHATGQVVHFDTSAERSDRAWLLGINSNLPPDINVFWARPVADRFHARFSALFRSYRYVILNTPVRSALERHRAWWCMQPLNAELMHEAAQVMVGTHDFSSFRASSCQAHTPVRTLTHLNVHRAGDKIIVDCRANAFLHHMVRNLLGSLARIGSGDVGPEWLPEVLHARDRKQSGITAPAAGLTLVSVEYAPELLSGQLR